MRKGFFGICLSLVVAIVLLAAFVPGCNPETKGSIWVKATLCGNPWPPEGSGFVDFELIPASGSPINGNFVPVGYAYLIEPGTCTCFYVGGGPAGAYLDTITPSATQSVSAGESTNFTLNFEFEQDAWIEFSTWTINGIPIGEYEWAYYEDGYWYADVTWCDVIDVEYIQHVDGCEGYEVTLNETDELLIHYYLPEQGGEPILVEVLNAWCAVNKTATPQGPPPEKLDQVPSYMGEPVEPPEEYPLPWCMNVTLDVETSWKLVKEIDYIKEINWLHIGECYDPPCDWCVLFNLLVPGPEFGFELRSCATVELVGDVDQDPGNNHDCGPPLRLKTVG